MREFSGKVKVAVAVWGFLLSAIQLYTAGFGILEPRLQRGIHVTMLMPLAFVLFPATRRSPVDRMTWMDSLLAFLSLLPGGYVLYNHAALNERWELVTPLTTVQLILGTLVVLLLLEATRRSVAPALADLAAAQAEQEVARKQPELVLAAGQREGALPVWFRD